MTTPNVNKSLSDIFDIELVDTDKSFDLMKIEAKAGSIDSLEKQRLYVKNNIVKLIEKGTTALDSMIAVATSTEDGKDFLVVKEMIKSLVESNMTLLEVEVIHKNKPETPGGTPKTVTNNTVFVGSTSELQKHLTSDGNNTIEND